MKNSVLRTMTEVAIFAALGFVLDMLAGAIWGPVFINGGSIGIALVCVFIISYRRGFVAGLATGLIMGLLDIADGFYSIAATPWRAFLQVALDYWLAYPLAALAGLFAPLFKKADTTNKKLLWLSVGCFVGGMAKFVSHYLSGVLFWNDPSGFAWPQYTSPELYSFVYNIAYCLPCIVLSLGILVIALYKAPFVFEANESFMRRKESK